MIKKSLFIVLLSFLMVSCGASKNVTVYKKPKKVIVKRTPSKGKPTIADKIVWTAVTYKGVPYKYGGITNRGMDCSGLIHTSFKQRKVQLPRTSRDMYTKGYVISLRQVQRGDLLFFKTSRKGRGVNHVGLVTSIKNGDIRFIHSTSSRGVIVTSLHENYWSRAFIKAKRVL
ncbi:C40 family peptidase [Tenacibaculum haliotis]|uniref:C40 family peptidase n=1 Tax=Tenacibaculum haliotis TaxID=1888914 RepID=UPI0021B081B9|nr:C40 family peptidase [Tenacibaculum haliotis]MCT4697833.1 C40 family peptidase [Tenacibaculum haliotis]